MKPILLVENKDDIALPLISASEQNGYAIVRIEKAGEAMRVLQETPDAFALLCCDALLPCIDGFEILQWVRQNQATQNLPTVMLCPVPNESVSYQEWRAKSPRYTIVTPGQAAYIAYEIDRETGDLNTGDILAAIRAVLCLATPGV